MDLAHLPFRTPPRLPRAPIGNRVAHGCLGELGGS